MSPSVRLVGVNTECEQAEWCGPGRSGRTFLLQPGCILVFLLVLVLFIVVLRVFVFCRAMLELDELHPESFAQDVLGAGKNFAEPTGLGAHN